jgi:mannosyl-oligosaccharide glucosidase
VWIYKAHILGVFSPHIGYASLFPFLFGLVPHDSPKVEHALNILTNARHLYSSFGIRSLSKQDRYFGKDENYWRGPIWINVNFLTLRALSVYYMNKEGPYQSRFVVLFVFLIIVSHAYALDVAKFINS